MSEEELSEHKKSFSDIEESIDTLYKAEKKAYNKAINPKRRKQV